jgi:hypothetical protein
MILSEKEILSFEVIGNLHLPLNFAVNIKLLYKK